MLLMGDFGRPLTLTCPLLRPRFGVALPAIARCPRLDVETLTSLAPLLATLSAFVGIAAVFTL